MKFKKSPPELIELFMSLAPLDTRVEPRTMFSYPCYFINGNLFAGLFEDSMTLRLPEADREVFLKLKGAARFEPMGRVMREYVLVPQTMLKKKSELQKWLERALDYAASLPKKTKRKKS